MHATRKSVLIVALAAVVGCLAAGPALGGFYNETAIHWPSWGNGSVDDSTDSIGLPDFTNVSGIEIWFATDKVNLLSVTIYYDRSHSVLKYGDLFINDVVTSGDTTWDYVVRSNVAGSGDQTGNMGPATLDIYSVSIAEDASNTYELSDDAWFRDGSKQFKNGPYGYREKHPWALASTPTSGDIGDVSFSGWKDTAPYKVTWDFSGMTGGDGKPGLELDGTDWILGFAVQCANDVIYQELPVGGTGDIIPEPGTLAIWGLLGLLSASACWWQGRRRKARGWSDENRQAIREIIDRGRRC